MKGQENANLIENKIKEKNKEEFVSSDKIINEGLGFPVENNL